MKLSVTGMTATVADQLLRYGWPGNVRELSNAIERAVALTRSKVIVPDDLPEEVRTNPDNVPATRPPRRASSRSGATLYRKLKQYKARKRTGREH